MGRSRGGITTTIPAPTRALGDLVDFRPPPGQARDPRDVADLIKDLAADHLPAEPAFDADRPRNAPTAHAIAAVIPPKRNRLSPANHDAEVYQWRHPIENLFASPTDNRGIATRYRKTNTSFSAFISIAANHAMARMNVNKPWGLWTFRISIGPDF